MNVRVGYTDDGHYVAQSDDLPGLNLCSKDLESLSQHIPEVIELLFLANSGVKVIVDKAIDASSFPRAPEPDVPFADGGERFVVEQAAVA